VYTYYLHSKYYLNNFEFFYDNFFLIADTSVAEPHHFYAASALGQNFYAAPDPTLTVLYSKAKF
jgi:hypothetical protein